jgi:hypothetical protein
VSSILLPSILRRPSFMSELWNVQPLSSAGSNNGVVLESNVYNVRDRVLIGSNNGVVLKSNVYEVRDRVLIGQEPSKP